MCDFSKVEVAPPDPILGLTVAFREDPSPTKVNLGVGAYRTNEGNPFLLSCVKKAEEIILNSGKYNHEYAPIEGIKEFNVGAARLLFGDEIMTKRGNCIASCQTISGTGAVRLASDFLRKYMPENTCVYMSDPTWGNHKNVFNSAGFQTKNYRYYKRETNNLDIEGLLEDLQNAPSPSIILLHACAHNPTGLDPSPSEWERICNLIASKKHFAFIDSAYQGFASGEFERDGFSFRMFAEKGMDFLVCQSFAKNMGLYGERIGALHVVTSNPSHTNAVLSQLKRLVRANYSSPPVHGAYVASLVLNTPELMQLWKKEVKEMADRIIKMRKALRTQLENSGTPGDWSHITSQIGMFSFTGLNTKQVDMMIKKHHIYLTSDGRISMAGLNDSNVEYVAKAIKDVVLNNNL